MKIIYCHTRKSEYFIPEYQYATDIRCAAKGGITVAMEAIQSWLLDTLEMGNTIERKIGIARCSDEDNYCKKTGRQIAQSRLKSKTLKVVNKVKIADFIIMFFEDSDGNLFEFKKSKDPYCAQLIRILND